MPKEKNKCKNIYTHTYTYIQNNINLFFESNKSTASVAHSVPENYSFSNIQKITEDNYGSVLKFSFTIGYKFIKIIRWMLSTRPSC